ncbi:MAG: MmcQ/YjbR family DNA-binding protein [Parvularculaceae bacterium]
MARDQIARVRRLCLALPGVEEGTSYGTTAFRVRKKLLVRMKEDGAALVLKTATLEDKELFLKMQPEIYYEPDHYKGWPAVLIRLPKISDAQLKSRIEEAWRREAGKKLMMALEGSR